MGIQKLYWRVFCEESGTENFLTRVWFFVQGERDTEEICKI